MLAAYSTMLRSQRQELHARIGKVLEDQFPEIVDNQPEIFRWRLRCRGVHGAGCVATGDPLRHRSVGDYDEIRLAPYPRT